ncbi:hypothetical protein M8C13_05120 [Crossiella sp. SN42]|uniref:hypothetical protein n=1 Tax=Crossiella sp. SN42 TaxID=2944808 RepID=UPI00207D3A9B|nr:hypothetical protein [Crossiella sp. SN42]MCO1575139.1 hypothetical protein [Crossiella sp. SN42]
MDEGIQEHLVITADRVILLDDQGAVDRTWHCAPGEPNLHAELTHAGIPTRPDPHTSTGTPGSSGTIHLVVDLTADRAELLTDQDNRLPLPAELEELVLAWLRWRADDCE